MNPYTVYWLTTIGIIAISLIVGGAVGYAVGLQQGVNMFLVNDDDEDILESEEIS